MKWFTTQKWLVFCLGFFLVIGLGSVLWAEDGVMEEEEETIQARPNPMDKTTLKGRTGNSALQGSQMAPKADRSLKNKQGVSTASESLKPSGADLGSSVGKELGDDIVDPVKKTGKAIMNGQ
jgi:hypothetical protein